MKLFFFCHGCLLLVAQKNSLIHPRFLVYNVAEYVSGLDLSRAVEWGKPLSQKSIWDSNYQPVAQPNDQWSSVPEFWRNIMFHQMNSNTQWNATNDINSAILSVSKTTFTGKFTDLGKFMQSSPKASCSWSVLAFVECKGDQDCHKENVTLSCMGASPKWSGRCMPREPFFVHCHCHSLLAQTQHYWSTVGRRLIRPRNMSPGLKQNVVKRIFDLLSQNVFWLNLAFKL